jgi:hypothetical protein
LENRLNGLRPELVGEIGVHAGGKEVSVLLLQGRLWRVGCCLQIGIEQVIVVFGQFIKAAPSGLIGWNGIVLPPVPTGILIEVNAWVCSGVDGGEIEDLWLLRSGLRTRDILCDGGGEAQQSCHGGKKQFGASTGHGSP